MLRAIAIRYIYDTPHLNIICIISYSDIFHFFRAYTIILISLQRTAGPSCCLLFVIRKKISIIKNGKTGTINCCRLIILHTPPTIRENVASL